MRFGRWAGDEISSREELSAIAPLIVKYLEMLAEDFEEEL